MKDIVLDVLYVHTDSSFQGCSPRTLCHQTRDPTREGPRTPVCCKSDQKTIPVSNSVVFCRLFYHVFTGSKSKFVWYVKDTSNQGSILKCSDKKQCKSVSRGSGVLIIRDSWGMRHRWKPWVKWQTKWQITTNMLQLRPEKTEREHFITKRDSMWKRSLLVHLILLWRFIHLMDFSWWIYKTTQN